MFKFWNFQKESSTQKNKHNQLKYNIKQQINDDIPRVLQNCSSNCELEIVDLAENTEISFDLDSNKFKSTILNHNKKVSDSKMKEKCEIFSIL